MRMLMIARLPHETFNAAVREGSAGRKTQAILDELKPEAVYFTEMNGNRTVIMIVDLESPSKVPALAEPWFLTFNENDDLFSHDNLFIVMRIVLEPIVWQPVG